MYRPCIRRLPAIYRNAWTVLHPPCGKLLFWIESMELLLGLLSLVPQPSDSPHFPLFCRHTRLFITRIMSFPLC